MTGSADTAAASNASAGLLRRRACCQRLPWCFPRPRMITSSALCADGMNASLGSITLAIATKFLLCDLFCLAEGLQIDSQLLALLVEMAALEAQRAGYIRHVKIVAANLV